MTNEIDDSGIPIRTIETFTDAELVDARLQETSPPPVKAKMSDVDLESFFARECAGLDDIDSLTAVTILNYLVQMLILRCSKSVEMNNGDGSSTSLASNELPSPALAPEEADVSNSDCSLPPSNDANGNGSNDMDKTPEENNEPAKSPSTNKIMQNKMISKRFTLKSSPPVSVEQYLERINHYCGLSTAVYLTSSLYLYKIVIISESFKLNDRNAHRMLIAALRISCKTIEDINHRQSFIAKIGGINNKDLLSLEIGLLYLLNFKCQVTKETLSSFLIDIKNLHVSHNEQSL